LFSLQHLPRIFAFKRATRAGHHFNADDEVAGLGDQGAHFFAPGTGRPAKAAMAQAIGISGLAAALAPIRTLKMRRGIPPRLQLRHDVLRRSLRRLI